MLLPGTGILCSTRADESVVLPPSETLTNVSQFRALNAQDYLRGCSFRLTGTVTLLDTNRNLLVLQGSTGAVAIYLDLKANSVQIGQRVSIEASDASPYVERLPDYPYRPSGWDIQPSFEAPSNWGDYHLTRMRGYLHPPATGNYTFWIASDNSSELWLSATEDPAKVRRIAFVGEGFWVNPREWSRYSSQRSETIFLHADRTYYIEAFQEQITLADNLSVAWQGPGLNQSVIAGRYLTPWAEGPVLKVFAATNGILREYWTNYLCGTVAGISGPRSYESALTAKGIHLTVLGSGSMPQPRSINLHRALPLEDNYIWGEVEGTVSFMASDGNSAILELTDGQGRTQLRVASYQGKGLRIARNQRLRVQGVCEGTHSIAGPLTPGLIWVPSGRYISFLQPEITNLNSTTSALLPPVTPANTNNTDLGGFYACRGVVTFCGEISNRNYLFVQDDNGGGVFIAPSGVDISPQLQVGQWVQTGGSLLLGKSAPGIQPLILRTLGWHTMPEPIIESTDTPLSKSENGLWAEVEGVVRKINPNGVMVIAGKKGLASVWIEHTPTNVLSQYVDATLKMRGVISSAIYNAPVLLVPSRNYIEIEEKPPHGPSAIPLRPIANLDSTEANTQWVHRVRIEGVVTYKDESNLFIQDASGGACVQSVGKLSVEVGETVQAVGFREGSGLLTEALVQSTGVTRALEPQNLNLADITLGARGNTLVSLKANLLGENAKDIGQVLELQEGQRVFEAVLATKLGRLPALVTGSRLKITGVCDFGSVAGLAAGNTVGESPPMGSLRIWLRSPSDVVWLSGPPWWTWKRVVALIGTMLIVLLGTGLWIYLLQRRLEWQQVGRLAFSRQVLQGQESERRRIAANLHDSLGQNLLVIKNQARLAMHPTVESGLRLRLNEISEMASQAIEEVRRITHDLRPYQLDRLGLTQTIRAAIRRVSENGPISFASDVENIDGLLDPESEIHLYRIVQESLNNVVKHSGATEATVVVKKQLRTVSFCVRDNGRGFDASIMNLNNSLDAGFGLSGINERARILGGTLTIDSRPGKGVNLTIEIPLSLPKHEAPG